MLLTTRPQFGPIGVFSWGVVTEPAAQVRPAVQAMESMGFAAVWFPESRGREAFTAASLLLESTERIGIATGIASIWARDPMAAAFGAAGLAEAHPGRVVLGLGVSHAPSVSRRGHEYVRPLERMRGYLDDLSGVPGPFRDAPAPPVVLAALGPKMLGLAGERTAGAHPYFVPVAHTRFARSVIGPDAFLAPEQAVVLETDPGRARAAARDHMERYLALDNYRRNLLRLGMSEADLDGPSDEVVDAIVAWGDAASVADRIKAHLEAGADHVSMLVLGADPFGLESLERLAEELL